MKAAKQFGWSKAELIENIAAAVHENIFLAIEEEMRNNEVHEEAAEQKHSDAFQCKANKIRYLTYKVRCWMKSKNRGKRRRSIASYRTFAARKNAL